MGTYLPSARMAVLARSSPSMTSETSRNAAVVAEGAKSKRRILAVSWVIRPRPRATSRNITTPPSSTSPVTMRRVKRIRLRSV